MNSRPWLAVAVYVRAPAAEAPMHTDIAPNSLSTLRNSQVPSSPAFTICESPSTMWVWGEIGYAQMTSGLHAATVSATAREPSICLCMGVLPERVLDEPVRGTGRRRIAGGRCAREALADRGDDGFEAHDGGQRREPAEQRRARERPTEVLARELRGRHRHQAGHRQLAHAEG